MMLRTTLVAITLVSSVSTALAMGDKPPRDDAAVAARIQPVATLQMAPAAGSGPKGAKSGEEIYKGGCAGCHESGVAGAPKPGDKGAWAPRLAQGLEGLQKSANTGKNAMPPRGGAEVTDNELARAIIFMANKSGASFKEPKLGK